MKKLLLFIILSFNIWLLTPALGDVNQDLSKFFNSLGASTNATSADVYQDQAAGFYTGGSLFARNTVHTAQLGSLRVPGYRAGCGGIDMHFGAFSFISGQELIRALRNIGSNMQSYGLLLALETMSPMVKNVSEYLNDLAQKINQSNINSCEMAATTLGAIWPQSDTANRQLCTMIGSDRRYGNFSDYAAARQGCGAGGKLYEVLNAGEQDPRFAKMLGTEFNLAWKTIQENDFLRKDHQLAELFMSLSGTIISTRHEDGYLLVTKPSLADKNSLLTALLYGGNAQIYKCRDMEGNKCLNVVSENITIDPQHALVTKARAILTSIQNKIYADEALESHEKGFLNSTRLPFYKILNVTTAFRRGTSPLDINDYSELAAIDMLFHYISQTLDVMHESASHLKSAQVDDTQIRQFLAGLNVARKRVVDRRMGAFKQIEQIISIIRKTELIEKTIASKLSTVSSEGI